MNRVSAYIIAFNEAEKIESAIRSVLWADEVVVVDSHSTDATAEIAVKLGARVVQVPFTGFGDLRNQAMAACAFDWIFSLDADERCTAQARDEIRAILQSEAPEDAYYVPRKNFFMGKWVRHSGFYPDYRQPQLFRKGAISFKPEPVHETFILHTEKIGYLSSDIWQFPFKDFEQILQKANRYSTLGAEKMAREGRKGGMFKALTHGVWAFLHHYVIKLGVLDGWAGFVIALGNFEGTFYKYAKLHEKMTDFRPPGSEHL